MKTRKEERNQNKFAEEEREKKKKQIQEAKAKSTGRVSSYKRKLNPRDNTEYPI